MAKSHTICSYFRSYLNCKLKLIFILFTTNIIIFRSFLSKQPDCSRLCPYQSTLTYNRLTFDNSHFVQYYSEFVCPHNFRNLADWVYGWPKHVSDEQLSITTTKGYDISSCLASGSIIFVKTDDLEQFFDEVYPDLSNQFVLITGQSDASSPGRYLSYLEKDDSKIIHWFSQNSEIYSSRNNKFTHIPIDEGFSDDYIGSDYNTYFLSGINCYEMANAIRNVYQRHSNHTLPSVYGGKDEPRQYSHLLDVTYKTLNGQFDSALLLLNFQRKTDPTGFRSRIWKVLCNPNFTSTFATCIDKPIGVDISTLSNIYARNRQYPFWLSPRGNGIDCHRTWEALYLDVIPIVLNSTINPLYADLPVIILNGLDEITESFLRTKLKEIARNKVKKPPVYRFEKLTFSFWRHLILSKSRHSVTATKRENQCWYAQTTTVIA